MKCGFCGHEFAEENGVKGCGSCGGGCRGVHCPRCNYKNPLEPALIKKLRAIFNKETSKGADDETER